MVLASSAVVTPVAGAVITPTAVATPVAVAALAPVVPLTPAQGIAALQAKQDAILLDVKNNYLLEKQLLEEINVLVSQRTKAQLDTALTSYHVAILTQEQAFNM